MSNLFTPKLKDTLFQSVFIALLVFLLQNYLVKLWAPGTAAETLKQQNYISSKKDAYFDAINLVTRELSGYDFHVAFDTIKNFSRIKGTTLPTEFEINSCLNKLYLFSNDEVIINSFKRIFAKGYNPIEQNIIMTKYIRKDLGGYENAMLNNYQYVQMSRDTTLK